MNDIQNNNPLKQYFRRPGVYLTLPSKGKFYDEGVIDMPENGELPVYPMTAIDEITSRTPDALVNGVAVVELIKSCIPNIKDPWLINSIDLDAILIAIKSASGDGSMEVESDCPNCQTVTKYDIELMNILAGFSEPNYSAPFTVNELKIYFRPLSYREIQAVAEKQFNLQRQYANLQNIEDTEERVRQTNVAVQTITQLTMGIIAETVEYIETPTARVDEREYILDFISNCDKKTFEAIKDHQASLKGSSEIKPLDINCPECQHSYNQSITLNPSDFFG